MASVMPQGASEASLTSEKPSQDGVANPELGPDGTQPPPQTTGPPQREPCPNCNVLKTATITGMVVHLMALVMGILQLTLGDKKPLVPPIIYIIIGLTGLFSDFLAMVGGPRKSVLLLRVALFLQFHIEIVGGTGLGQVGMAAALRSEKKLEIHKNVTEFKEAFGDTTKVAFLTTFIPLMLFFIGFSFGMFYVIAKELVAIGPLWGGGVVPATGGVPAPGEARPNVEQ